MEKIILSFIRNNALLQSGNEQENLEAQEKIALDLKEIFETAVKKNYTVSDLWMILRGIHETLNRI